ncbi:MAG: septum formation family protein [Candidatus Limnocylindrales bacterium]
MADDRSSHVVPNTLSGQPVGPNTLSGVARQGTADPGTPRDTDASTDPGLSTAPGPPADEGPAPVEPSVADSLPADAPAGWVAAAPVGQSAARGGGLLGLARRFWWILLIVALAAGGVLLRDYMSGSAGDLKAGDCFDEPTASAQTEVKDVQHHPCGDAHTAEVIGVFTYDAPRDAAMPSVDAFDAFVGDRCVPAFEAYVGRSFQDAADLDMGYFYPSDSGWASGDRAVTCYLSPANGQPIRGSLRSSAP